MEHWPSAALRSQATTQRPYFSQFNGIIVEVLTMLQNSVGGELKMLSQL